MQFKLGLIPAATAAMLLVACGGGSNNPNPPTPTPSMGVAVDGYIQFAKVVCDLNDNGTAETNETVVYTRADGNFTFPSACTHGIIVSGGRNLDITNADNTVTPGTPFVGVLRAPAGATVASPLTTLLAAGMTADQVKTALGLPAGTNLLTDDPMVNNPELLKKTVLVQNLMQKMTETFAKPSGASGSVALSAIYTEAAAAFADVLKTGVTPIGTDGKADESVINTLIKAAGDKVLASPLIAAVAPEVKVGMNKVGTTVMAAALDKALKADADKVLVETDPVKIASATLKVQANEEAANFINSQIVAGTLTSSSTTAEVEAVAEKVVTAVAAGPTPTPPAPTGTLLVSFDETAVAFTGMGGFGGALPDVVPGPTGGSANALKIVKPVNAIDSNTNTVVNWGGAYFGVAAVPFTSTRKSISARVYSTRAGAIIKFKVEATDKSFVEVASTPTGAANTWQTVTWDMSNVDVAKSYVLMAITPDSDLMTSGQTYYIDEITLAAAVVDTQAPTLSITDNIAANSASGTVTFNFTFSEDVGTSFAASDIVVTGGTLGALNRTDSKNYTAVVTPTANATGTINVSVAAGSFQDVSNNSSTTAATASQAFDTTSAAVVQDTVLLTFDEATPLFTGMGGYGGALPDVVGGPGAGSALALKIVKPAGQEVWGGIYFGLPAIPFTQTRKTLTAQVYATRAGAVIKLKVEAADKTFVEIASAPTGAANTWQTVSWEMSAVDLAKTYTIMAITPDAELVTAGQSYYLDNITLAAGAVVVPPDTTAPAISITDNVPANTTAGPVTFNFIFSEDVGNSFTVADITPSGGMLSAFTKLSQTHYTAVLTPAANSSGTATVSVAAGAFSDLANNANSAAATASQAFDTLVPVQPANYLYLTNNAITLFNGTSDVTYTMADFQGTGINVKWPMADTASLKLNLAENGSFLMGNGQTLNAAMEITETVTGGLGQISGYIENVLVTKAGGQVTVTVPTLPKALLYGVSHDGQMKAVVNFAGSVAGVTNTLSSAANTLNSITLGNVVNYAINGVSNDFTGMNVLRGKYKVRIVLSELPLRKTDGSKFDVLTISVPTTMSAGVPGTIVPVTGWGLEGYINLVN